jgi:hypothetical protein
MPVTGVGGAADADAASEADGKVRAAEAKSRLVGCVLESEEDTVASAAFRFLVMGGIVSSGEEDFGDARRSRAVRDSMVVAPRDGGATGPRCKSRDQGIRWQ